LSGVSLFKKMLNWLRERCEKGTGMVIPVLPVVRIGGGVSGKKVD